MSFDKSKLNAKASSFTPTALSAQAPVFVPGGSNGSSVQNPPASGSEFGSGQHSGPSYVGFGGGVPITCYGQPGTIHPPGWQMSAPHMYQQQGVPGHVHGYPLTHQNQFYNNGYNGGRGGYQQPYIRNQPQQMHGGPRPRGSTGNWRREGREDTKPSMQPGMIPPVMNSAPSVPQTGSSVPNAVLTPGVPTVAPVPAAGLSTEQTTPSTANPSPTNTPDESSAESKPVEGTTPAAASAAAESADVPSTATSEKTDDSKPSTAEDAATTTTAAGEEAESSKSPGGDQGTVVSPKECDRAPSPKTTSDTSSTEASAEVVKTEAESPVIGEGEDSKKKKKPSLSVETDSSRFAAGAQDGADTGRTQYSKEDMMNLKEKCTDMPVPDDVKEGLELIFAQAQDTPRSSGRRPAGPPSGGRTPRSARDSRRKDDSKLWERGRAPPSPNRARGKKEPEITIKEEDVKPLEKSDNAWSRTDAESPVDVACRMMQSILNKITPEKYHRLKEQIYQIPISDVDVLRAIVDIVFSKAVNEPAFAEMYAQLCQELSAPPDQGGLPAFAVPDEEKLVDFRRLLIGHCQRVFTSSQKSADDADNEDLKHEHEQKMRRLIFGNVRFIGELFVKRIVKWHVLQFCFGALLGDYKNSLPDEESLESLCKLLTTVGSTLECLKKPPGVVDEIMSVLELLIHREGMVPRMKFMLQDIIDLRKDHWKGKEAFSGPKPVTLAEVHEEAYRKEKGGSFKKPQRSPPVTPRRYVEAVPPSASQGPQDFRCDPAYNPGAVSPTGGLEDDEWEVAGSKKRQSKGKKLVRDTPPGRRGERERSDRAPPRKGAERKTGTLSVSAQLAQSRADAEGLQQEVQAAAAAVADSEPSQTHPEDKLKNEARIAIEEFAMNRLDDDVREILESLQCPAQHADFVFFALLETLEMKESQRKFAPGALLALAEGCVSEESMKEAFVKLLNEFDNISCDYPFLPRFLGTVLAKLVAGEKFPLAFLENDSLANLPKYQSSTIVCSLLDGLAKEKTQEAAVKIVKDSEVDLKALLEERDVEKCAVAQAAVA
eukprot:Rmarinus@m.20859